MSIAVVVPGQILFEEDQAAAVLGISDRKLRELKIPTVNADGLSKRNLYHRADLEAFAEQLRATS
jgi:hypothetical protein